MSSRISEGVLTPEQILRDLGIPFEERPNRLVVHCPFHHDTRPSSGVYLDTGLFHCYACALTLDLLSFYAKVKGIEKVDAEKELGGVPKSRSVNKVVLERNRKFYEKALQEFREGQQDRMRAHAQFGEMLDKVLQKYERGELNELQMDTALEKWYGKVQEERTRARTEPEGSPGTRPNVRVKEGLAGVPGSGRSGGEQTLGEATPPSSDEMAAGSEPSGSTGMAG